MKTERKNLNRTRSFLYVGTTDGIENVLSANISAVRVRLRIGNVYGGDAEIRNYRKFAEVFGNRPRESSPGGNKLRPRAVNKIWRVPYTYA